MKKPFLWILVIAVASGVAWSLYWLAPSSLRAPATEVSVPTDWIPHQDPKGFMVSLPPEWKVRPDPSNGRVDFLGEEGDQVTVWPLFVSTELTSNSAVEVLVRLSSKVFPDGQWQAVQAVGSDAIRHSGSSSDREAVSILTWTNSPQGTAAFFYLMAAPSGRYRLLEETFSTILSSFRISRATETAAEQSPQLSYVRWQDPREKAFSFEVPEDWKVSGGLFRLAAVDTRPAFVALSPDGAIRISGGDSDIPTYTEPTPVLQMAGFYEGSWYSPGYGVRMMVRRFVPPVNYVKDYIAAAVARGCGSLSFTAERERPDAVKTINAINARFNNPVVSSVHYAGEAAFTCRLNDQWRGGYYFIETSRAEMQAGSLWNIEYLYGYMAPREDQEKAQQILEHLLSSFQLNPQWVAMQHDLTATTSQIVSQTNEQISNLISQAYQFRTQTEDELSRQRENAILGVEDVVDPLTGEQFKVGSGSNYQWIDQHGIIVGTNTDTRPNLDFRKLVRLP